MLEIFNEEGHKLIGEPVTRPDGTQMSVWQLPSGDIYVDSCGERIFYHRGAVEFMGEGNFSVGVDRIAQGDYKEHPPKRHIDLLNTIYKRMEEINPS